MEATRRQEVAEVAARTFKSWHEEEIEKAKVELRPQMEAEVRAAVTAELTAQVTAQVTLATRRGDLLALLEERFGPLPADVVSAIQAETDLGRLQAGIRRGVQAATLDEWRTGALSC